MTTTESKLRLPAQAIKAMEEPKSAEEIKPLEGSKPAESLQDALTPTIEDLLVLNPELDKVLETQASTASVDYPTYQAGRLTQFVMPNGNVVKPVDGIYTATTEEMFNMLNYYAQQDSGLVTPLF